MKFAILDSQRREAQPDLSGECPVCGDAMIAKCGNYRIWHWAHKGHRLCDVWWERETEWHRDWKDRFPKEWQEAIRHADSGEKHVADVMTAGSLVLEFQHSHLSKDERISRENFYGNMMWVVDGLRRVRDNPHFLKSLGTSQAINLNPLTFSVPNSGALLRDWSGSRVQVFFDFGNSFEPDHPFPFDVPVLWRLNPASPEGTAQLSPVVKAHFVAAVLNGTPLPGINLSHAAPAIAAIQRREVHGGFDPLAIRRQRRRF